MKPLSPRLQKVVDRMLLGEKPVQIAQALGLTEDTVRTYQKLAYVALGVHSQIELVARMHSLVPIAVDLTFALDRLARAKAAVTPHPDDPKMYEEDSSLRYDAFKRVQKILGEAP